MTATTARNRIVDLVPHRQRRQWSAQGHYRDVDLFGLFTAQVERDPHRVAVVDDDGTVTFAELRDAALRLAGGLAARGVRPGDVVGVQLPNSRLACTVDLAVLALGGVTLPFPAARGGRDAAALLGSSGATCAVVAGVLDGHDYVAQTLRLAGALPALRTVISADRTESRCETVADLMAGPVAEPVPVDPDGAARIMVSSGTEAAPKMVAFSHNALATGLGAVVGEVLRPGQRPRSLWLVALCAAFGSNALVGTLIMHGGTLVLQRRFTPVTALDLIVEHRPTHLFGVPAMLRLMLDNCELAARSPFALEAIVVGGAKLDDRTANAAADAFGCPVVSTYGSSDGVHCALGGARGGPRRGLPNPAVVDIRIVDEHLRDVPTGQVGEIIARGPFTPMSYVGAPTLNARYRTAEGWVRTDDLGLLDPAGRLSVVDRRNEIVNRGGANISPVEVEGLILGMPAVSDAACVGVPDDELGERLCACVVPVEGAVVDLADLVGYLRERDLEPRKLPERLVLLPQLPYTPTGKVDRSRLRATTRELLRPARPARVTRPAAE